MNFRFTGLTALIFEIGFIVVLSSPVWLAARLVRARHPTLLHAALALLLGTIGAWASVFIGGNFIWLLAPLSFLLSFKFVMGTSFLGAIALALLALAGYWVMLHFIGAGLVPADRGTPV